MAFKPQKKSSSSGGFKSSSPSRSTPGSSTKKTGGFKSGGSSTPAPKSKTSGGPSNFMRVMDVLSRGNYAVAEATRRNLATGKSKQAIPFVQASNPDFWKGLAAGASGKKKTTFSGVLGDINKMKPGTPLNNRVVRGGLGFALDVATDPTNLIGTGVVKAPLKAGKAVTTGGKAANAAADATRAAKLAEDVKAAEIIQQVVSKARPVKGKTKGKIDLTQILAALPKNADTAIPPVGKTGLGVSDEIMSAVKGSDAAPKALDQVDEVLDAAPLDPSPGLPGLTDAGAPLSKSLSLKIAGVPILKSERLYKAAAKPGNAFAKTTLGSALNQSFRTGAGLLPEVQNLQRIFAGQGRQETSNLAEVMHKIYSGTVDGVEHYPRVNKKDQKRIFYAIQEGPEAVDILPKELKIPAQLTQEQLARVSTPKGMANKLDDVASDGDFTPLPEAVRNARFEELPVYKGATKADGTPKVFDRAPQAFIAQYDRAVRKEYFTKFTDEVAKRFPEQSAEMIANMKRTREVFGADGEVSAKWLSMVNSVQGPWKRYITQYRPGFHVRNMISDTYMTYLAGVNPSRFKDSARVLANNMGKNSDGRIKLGRQTYSLDEAEGFYRKAGLETSFFDVETIGASQRKLGHAVTQFSQQREKYLRMATFLDTMDGTLKRGGSIQKAIEEAAFKVRKYHFDYADITPFERKIRGGPIPFYTYARKALPLMLESTLTKPGKISTVPKIGSAAETMLGVEKDPDDPFPGIDGLLPEYMKDQQIIQRGANKVFSPGLPTDLLQQTTPGAFIREQAGGLSPLIKAPIEIASRKSIPLGYNLQKKDQKDPEFLSRYLLSLMPYGNLARDTDTDIRSRVINMLNGLGGAEVRKK